MSDTAIIQVCTVILVIGGWIYNYRKDKRNRAWDIEDRQIKFNMADTKRTEVAEKTEVIAQEVKDSLLSHDCWEKEERDRTIQLLEEAVEHAKAAYHEANTVNEKLASLSIGSTDQLNKIEKNVQDLKK